MKIIEVDDELYHYIASKTEKIGEPASSILRRLLGFDPLRQPVSAAAQSVATAESAQLIEDAAVVVPSTTHSAESETPAAAQPEQNFAESALEANDTEAPTKAATTVKKPRKLPGRKPSPADQKEAEAVAQLTPSEKLAQLSLQDLPNQHGAVGRFLYILQALEQRHGDSFAGVVEIKGRDRLYFADNKEVLLQSGSSTNPKRIGHTPFWVITNNNTSRKKWMLSEVAKMLGYSESDLRILAAKI